MFYELDDLSAYDSSELGSSPPSRPVVPECSDLFKSVMEEFVQEDSRLSRAVVDSVLKRTANNRKVNGSSVDSGNSAYAKTAEKVLSEVDKITRDKSSMCKRCLSDRDNCKCRYRRNSKVQWVDELFDKPLAIEQAEMEPNDGRGSPHNSHSDFVKPILKHKANCVIIVSE